MSASREGRARRQGVGEPVSVAHARCAGFSGGRSGVQYSLRFDFDQAVRARPYLLAVPSDAKPDDDLARVLQAIAEQSAAVTFDHAMNRIRLGHRAFR